MPLEKVCRIYDTGLGRTLSGTARDCHFVWVRNMFLPPAQFEAWFVSTAHSEADLGRTARAVEESLPAVFASQSP